MSQKTRTRRRSRVAAAAGCTVGALSTIMPATSAGAQTEPEPLEPPAEAELPPLPQDPVGRARWAADAALESQSSAGGVAVRELDETNLELRGKGKAIGRLTYGDGADTATTTAVVEALEHEATRITFILDARPSDDDVAFNASFEPGVLPQVLPSGQLVLWQKGEVSGVFDAPWAVDADGAPVRTWFELDGQRLAQRLDLSDPAIAYPVMADPTYTPIPDWVTVTNTATTSQYMYGHAQPASKAFIDSQGYYPLWGSQEGVTRVVEEAGKCTLIRDTSWRYNFAIPCKMHDHCWNMRRVGIYPNVQRATCDSMFNDAMRQHCTWRNDWTTNACFNKAADAYFAVRNYPFGP